MSGFTPADPRHLPRAAALARRAEGAVPQRLALIDVADLDLPPGLRRRPDPAAEAAARAAAARAAEIAAAREAGRAEGEAEGRAAAAAAHAGARATAEAAALAAAAAALGRIAGTTEASVGTAATALARMLLAALDAALPAAAARLAPESALDLAAAMRPVLQRAGAVTLHVAPGLAEAVAQRLGDPRLTVREDAALAPGDARAEWGDGEATALLADRRLAIAAVLGALGLAPDATGEGST